MPSIIPQRSRNKALTEQSCEADLSGANSGAYVLRSVQDALFTLFNLEGTPQAGKLFEIVASLVSERNKITTQRSGCDLERRSKRAGGVFDEIKRYRRKRSLADFATTMRANSSAG